MLNRNIELLNKTITIEQDLSLSHAGTVWDGSLVLAYYLQKNQKIAQQYFLKKNVLELGSGTGLLGICVSLFKPNVVYLTDFQEFLPILKRNCQGNVSCWQSKKQEQGDSTRVQIKSLRWGNEQDMQKFPDIDTIIGSQLAYDAQNIGYLINTFLYFLNKNPSTKILISYQKYENKDRNLYDRLCKVKQVKCVQVNPQDMNEDYYDSYIGILMIQGNRQS